MYLIIIEVTHIDKKGYTMQKMLIRLILILSISLIGVISFAQNDTLLLEVNESNTFITIPADWQDNTDDDGVLTVSDDAVIMMVYTADVLEDLFEIDAPETATELIEAVTEELPLGDDAEFDLEEIEELDVDERDGARLDFTAEDVVGNVTAVAMSDETIGVIVTMITGDTSIGITATLDDIIETFNTPSQAKDAPGSSATDSDTETATSTEACIISTADSNTVQIRVGPGLNRTVIAFLPALVDFEALGQTTDDAGNVWFRVPQEEVAPTKAVNETWVAADDVDQSGDCVNVVDAAAPPIIPIRQAQPTAVPQTDTATDSSGGETTQPDAPVGDTVDASGAIIPEQGTWFLQLNSGTVQCSGGFSGQANPTTGSITGTLVGGGSAGFVFDVFFFQYRGGNDYQAATVYSTSSGGEVVESLTLTMTSSRTATGNLGYVDGPCTYNAPITLNFIG